MDFKFATQPLAKCATFLSGGTPSKSNPKFWGGSIPWITPKDMANWDGTTAECVTHDAIGNGTRLAPAWTSYIAVRGMSLHNEIRVVRPSFSAAFNQDIKAVRALGDVDGRFLYYCLVAHKRTLLEKVESAGHGTGRLPTDQLESLPIPKVGSDIASSIAKILGDLDDKVDVLREMNRTLEDIARTLYKAWFVDFLPVRAKAAGATTFRGMPQALFDALPDNFGPSAIGEIPKGWKITPLGGLVSQPIRRGLAPKYVNTGGVAVLNQKCIRNWEVDYNFARLHKAAENSLGDRIIHPYDILVNSTGVGTLGRVAQIYEVGEITTFDSHVSLVRPDVDKVSPLFLGFNLTEREFEIERLGHGSTGQTELSRQKLSELAVVVPEKALQMSFDVMVQPAVSRRSANRTQIAILNTLRDTLLPKLISGELQAPNLSALAHAEERDGS
ncbi:restriction endonuclease subunit S [Rhizobium leguminosarum]|uniref:restriction endonuclease subunit S n=1 Tax=Rhizobium leguminosarum TaxID=384 RepID=UPI003F9D1A46